MLHMEWLLSYGETTYNNSSAMTTPTPSCSSSRRIATKHSSILIATLLCFSIIAMHHLLTRPSFAATTSITNTNNINNNHRRQLHQRAYFNVQLFLDLQFVNESLALDFETLDNENPNIVHFCRAIQSQVRIGKQKPILRMRTSLFLTLGIFSNQNSLNNTL